MLILFRFEGTDITIEVLFVILKSPYEINIFCVSSLEVLAGILKFFTSV